MRSLSIFFDVFVFPLPGLDSNLRIMTSLSMVLKLFIRDVSRNPENENTPACDLSNICKLWQMEGTKGDMEVSNK